MASQENRQCPHFDIQEGVCGCPEFWQSVSRRQNNQASLQEVSSLRYGQGAPENGRSSTVNSIPLPDRTRSHPITPAPPGSPKETCFFWYHGACRRGDQCERPHEANATWPIPPPPGFRHFQPCTLPLCPLRADLGTILKLQEYQGHVQKMSGQVDGAAFNRTTIAGENSSRTTSDTTDTDLSETGSHSIATIELKRGVDNGEREDANAASEVKLEQTQRKSELDEPDYVDLTAFRSPSPIPFVKEETISSISHPGTRTKRCRLLKTTLSENINKRAKSEQGNSSDLEDATPTIQQPLTMSRRDVRPDISAVMKQYSETRATYHTRAESPPSFSDSQRTKGDRLPTTELQAFNPPKGPRDMDTLPPICFFFYHKGFCKPKRGRRCDYLHNKNTSQQSVSLPHGIDNHDPKCSLRLCPIRLRTLNRSNQEPAGVSTRIVPGIKVEHNTPSKIREPDPFDFNSPQFLDEGMAVRGGLARGMSGQERPQLTGSAWQHWKEQTQVIQNMQTIPGIKPETASIHKKHTGRLSKRGRRREKELAREAERCRIQMEKNGAISQGHSRQPAALGVQKPLPSLSVKEEAPAPWIPLPTDYTAKKRVKNRGGRRHRKLGADVLRPKDFVTDTDISNLVPQAEHVQSTGWGHQSSSAFSAQAPIATTSYGEQEVRANEAPTLRGLLDVKRHQWKLDVAGSRTRSAGLIVSHEYPPESLGLTADQRRAQLSKELFAKRSDIVQGFLQNERKSSVPEGMATSATSFETRDRGQNLLLSCNSDYQRESNSEKRWDHGCPYQHYEPAKSGTGSGFHRKETDVAEAKGVAPSRVQAAATYQLPEGDQRLDWDTDFVRRLFGEIE